MSEKVVGNILINIIPEEHLWKIKIFDHWDTIIGNLKSKVRIEKIDTNSLILGVAHSTWAQELFFLSPLLKQKINTILKEEKIKTIRIKTVTFSSPIKKEKKISAHTNDTIESCLTISEHSTLLSMKNPDLENALEQFYIRCKKANSLNPRSDHGRKKTAH